jgi:hypothetical protein
MELRYCSEDFKIGRAPTNPIAVIIAVRPLTFAGDTARSYAVALVQNIDAASTELFASAAYQTLNRTLGGSFHPILAAWTGARIRF